MLIISVLSANLVVAGRRARLHIATAACSCHRLTQRVGKRNYGFFNGPSVAGIDSGKADSGYKPSAYVNIWAINCLVTFQIAYVLQLRVEYGHQAHGVTPLSFIFPPSDLHGSQPWLRKNLQNPREIHHSDREP